MKFKVGDKVKVVRTNYKFKKEYVGKVFTIDRLNPNPYNKNPHYGIDTGCYVLEESELELAVDEKIVITHDGKTTTATLYRDGEKVTATSKCAPEDDFNFRVGAEIAMGRLVDKLAYAEYNVVRVVFREGNRPYSYKTRMNTAKVGMKIVVPVGRYGKEVNATVVEIIPGAKYNCEYAMSAMKEIDIVEAPKYYSGKVVCIANNCAGHVDTDFTPGKVYEVVNGKLIDNLGSRRPSSNDWIKTLSDLNNDYFSDWFYKFIPYVE